jgi:hypothetical protein
MAHSLTPEAVDLGRRENRDGLRLMAKCIASGVWPGLDQGIHTTGLRPWLLKGR